LSFVKRFSKEFAFLFIVALRLNLLFPLGYCSSGDTHQWVELGRGVDMNWTVIA